MIENLKENENYKYEIYDKFTCIQNIDRIKFYQNELNNKKIDLLSAGYHLDKQTQNKTGGIFFFQIDSNNKFNALTEENIILDYGILDIKFSKKNNSYIFTANSDYSYTIFDLMKNTKNKIYLYTPEEKDEKIKITNDILEMDNSEQKIFLGTNDGNLFIHDLNNQKNISTIKSAHDYGIWSIKLLEDNENVFLTGGEDAKIKLWDIRIQNKESKVNDKLYQSSINYIDTLKCDLSKNILITGSYDEKIIFFDIRNFPKELKSVKTEHSSWDIKQTNIKNQNLLLISSIYEGFNIWEINKEKEYDMNHILRLPLTKDKDIFHKSIVYGVDISKKEKDNSIDILSCSFYDNLMMYWNYSLK